MNKSFSEYRSQDYRTARSIKEMCGWDAPLYVEEPQSDLADWLRYITAAAIVAFLVIAFVVSKSA